jgi:hypothetical protein
MLDASGAGSLTRDVRQMNTNAQTHSDLIWSIEFVPNWTGIAAIVITAALIVVILRLRKRKRV